MRQLLFAGPLFLLLNCSSDMQQRQEWDSGAGARDSYQENQTNEQVKTTQEQFQMAAPRPNTYKAISVE